MIMKQKDFLQCLTKLFSHCLMIFHDAHSSKVFLGGVLQFNSEHSYLVGYYEFVLFNNFIFSDGSDSEKENQSFSQPDKEEEEGEQQTQPLRFDSDDDDVPLVSMGKRSRTAGSDTSPEGKRPRLMIDLGDDSADEVMSNSEYYMYYS